MGNRSDSLMRWSGRSLAACVVALVLGLAGHEALAQEPTSTCVPAVGRLVSLQGSVELQRAGSKAWEPVKRLDTSICAGDRLRTGALSRALLFVQPETIVRVDQNTAITVRQTDETIEVEFFASELAAQVMGSQSQGAGYFITRFPKKFKVVTPHMNAAVEGTEFMVQLGTDATKLTVIEGKVSSESVATRATQMVTAGQSIASGATGAGAIVAVITPQDAVQWVLRYPPLSDGSSTSTNAEELLQSGSVDAALAAIDAALAADPRNSDALALRAVIQIAKNDKVGALESATRAVESSAANFRSWLAMSYAQQASYDLQAALGSAVKAEALQSGNSLGHARVAELYLSLGDTRGAEIAARASIASNSIDSQAHTILGFVHLANIDTSAARSEFSTAIEGDSFNALPRLGLGLAMIRDGELVEGREQIEIAVALDPSNSLLRSYVGKAYYEENSTARDGLASTQFEQARALDPNDPTPWFYDSILKVSQSRPGAALGGFGKSTALNGDRAVYRSRQLLDQDLAARGSSQATVYNELGFHQLGLIEANRSLAIDPASSSAHRFLADIYATQPRYEIARASELLQAQLRQPLGASPLQAQLANDIVFQNTFFGPTSVGLNEYNPLFVQDGLGTQVFGLVGDNGTWGDQLLINGLNGPISFSLSQFAAETDGYRPNNDDSVRQYDAYIQWQSSSRTSAQLEISDSSRESGDLVSSFDPSFFSDVQRSDEDVATQRLGLRHVVSPHADLLVSVIHQDRHAVLDIPDLATTIIDDQESTKAELQYMSNHDGVSFIVGSSYLDGNSSTDIVFPPISIPSRFDPTHFNIYGYFMYARNPDLPQLQIGLSYDDLHSDVGDQKEFNPKLGLIWKLSGSLTLRLAGFRSLKRRINSDQGLEPTQVAGFNQLFDDRNGTISEGGGIALDWNAWSSAAVGASVTRRNLSVPYFGDELFFQDQREDVASGYFYWMPTERVSVAFEPRYHDFDKGTSFDRMTLTEVPLSVKYVSPAGLWLGLTLTGVEQSGAFTGPGGADVAGSDRFWLMDAVVAYRLRERRGTISLEGTNILGESFQFQEIDQTVAPRYVPEAQIRLRMSVHF